MTLPPGQLLAEHLADDVLRYALERLKELGALRGSGVLSEVGFEEAKEAGAEGASPSCRAENGRLGGGGRSRLPVPA